MERRAIVCFVEDKGSLVQQLLALRRSWLHAQSPDTDLVAMGPSDALERLPEDIVKIAQRPATDDPVWRDYGYINSITCLNGPGAERLDRYTHILRTDVDCFITPAWNRFYPQTFIYGQGGYSNDDNIRRRIQSIAAQYGLVHRGVTNIGSTWYGPTEVVRRACAFSEMLTKHLRTHHFVSDEGEWPGWFSGVSTMYAGEIAVNHCAPDARWSELLDVSSTSREAILRYAHIHCWHTDEKFSKHWFTSGRYTPEDAQGLDLSVIADYCMALSFQSLEDLTPRVSMPATPAGQGIPSAYQTVIGGVTDSPAHFYEALRDERPKKASWVRDEWLGEGMVLYNAFTAQTMALNATAALIWDYCDGRHDVASIADELREVFPNAPDTESDLVRVLHKLMFAGMIIDGAVPPMIQGKHGRLIRRALRAVSRQKWVKAPIVRKMSGAARGAFRQRS